MTHDAHDAGHPEAHDCKYAGRSRSDAPAHEAEPLDRALKPSGVDDRDYNDVEERRALIVDIRMDRIDPDTGLFRTGIGVPYQPSILYGPHEGVLRWVRLGPWGPSICTLVLLRVRPRGCWLLAGLRQHPFDTWFSVFGLVQDRMVTDREYVGRMVDRVIQRNGIPGCVLWKDALPTFVRSSLTYFSGPEMRELVFTMVEQFPELEVRQAIEDLSTWPLDPWKRCDAETQRAASTPSHLFTPRGPAPSRDLLEAWWALVTDPEHIEVEEAQVDAAWAGRMHTTHHRPEDPA
jgi:hypothetical protein